MPPLKPCHLQNHRPPSTGRPCPSYRGRLRRACLALPAVASPRTRHPKFVDLAHSRRSTVVGYQAVSSLGLIHLLPPPRCSRNAEGPKRWRQSPDPRRNRIALRDVERFLTWLSVRPTQHFGRISGLAVFPPRAPHSNPALSGQRDLLR